MTITTTHPDADLLALVEQCEIAARERGKAIDAINECEHELIVRLTPGAKLTYEASWAALARAEDRFRQLAERLALVPARTVEGDRAKSRALAKAAPTPPDVIDLGER